MKFWWDPAAFYCGYRWCCCQPFLLWWRGGPWLWGRSDGALSIFRRLPSDPLWSLLGCYYVPCLWKEQSGHWLLRILRDRVSVGGGDGLDLACTCWLRVSVGDWAGQESALAWLEILAKQLYQAVRSLAAGPCLLWLVWHLERHPPHLHYRIPARNVDRYYVWCRGRYHVDN